MSGSVIWLTGLSGSGKSTLANILRKDLLRQGMRPILLDGDELRTVFMDVIKGSDQYSYENRLLLSMRYSNLCKLLSEQGCLVIIATISMFKQVYSWNRKHLPNYLEIYLKTPIDELRRRDPKGIYQRFDRGLVSNVAGLDLAVDEPTGADLTLDFDSERSVREFSDQMKSFVCSRLNF